MSSDLPRMDSVQSGQFMSSADLKDYSDFAKKTGYLYVKVSKLNRDDGGQVGLRTEIYRCYNAWDFVKNVLRDFFSTLTDSSTSIHTGDAALAKLRDITPGSNLPASAKTDALRSDKFPNTDGAKPRYMDKQTLQRARNETTIAPPKPQMPALPANNEAVDSAAVKLMQSKDKLTELAKKAEDNQLTTEEKEWIHANLDACTHLYSQNGDADGFLIMNRGAVWMESFKSYAKTLRSCAKAMIKAESNQVAEEFSKAPTVENYGKAFVKWEAINKQVMQFNKLRANPDPLPPPDAKLKEALNNARNQIVNKEHNRLNDEVAKVKSLATDTAKAVKANDNQPKTKQLPDNQRKLLKSLAYVLDYTRDRTEGVKTEFGDSYNKMRDKLKEATGVELPKWEDRKAFKKDKNFKEYTGQEQKALQTLKKELVDALEKLKENMGMDEDVNTDVQLIFESALSLLESMSMHGLVDNTAADISKKLHVDRPMSQSGNPVSPEQLQASLSAVREQTAALSRGTLPK
jgi:hypothetical protein